MILAVIYSIISIACTASIYYFLNLYQNWWWFWVIIVGLPLFYILAFAVNLAVLYVIAKCVNKEKEVLKPNFHYLWWMEEVTKQLLFLSRTYVKKINMDEVNKSQQYMIVYNHTSNFDPMIIFSTFPKVICLTKPENKKIPIAGGFMHKAGYISIDRENDAEGIRSVQKAIDWANNGWCSICVSPEGTRSKNYELLPFRPGCFQIAKRTNMPILVIGFKGVYNISKNFPKHSTRCQMKVLRTISQEEIKSQSTAEISNSVYKIFEEYLKGE